MNRRFENSVAVVTGASSGVGRAIARAFGEEGARVALIARNEEALEIAAEEILLAGGDAMVIPVDVSDAEQVNLAAQEIVDRWGGIDIWINNAMATIFGYFDEVRPKEYERVTDVCYHGYVYGTLAALRHMRERDQGCIIQIGSAMAYRSIPLQSAYCGAKAAVRGFTDSLRTELLHQGSKIKLCQLQLPAVNTPQPIRQRNKTGFLSQPVPPMFSPESMAETTLWAAERMPREVLVGWPSFQAVMAQKLAPGIADWWLSREAVNGQLTERRLDPDREDLLFDVLPGDPGAHGPYEDRERGADWQMTLRKNLGVAGLAGGLLAAGLLGYIRRW